MSLSPGGRKEASIGLASFRTVSAHSCLPAKTVVRGDFPPALLSLLATTKGTDSLDVTDL